MTSPVHGHGAREEAVEQLFREVRALRDVLNRDVEHHRAQRRGFRAGLGRKPFMCARDRCDALSRHAAARRVRSERISRFKSERGQPYAASAMGPTSQRIEPRRLRFLPVDAKSADAKGGLVATQEQPISNIEHARYFPPEDSPGVRLFLPQMNDTANALLLAFAFSR